MRRSKNTETEKVYEGELKGSKVIVWKSFETLHESGFYGKIYDNRLEISPVEALFLLKKERLVVKEGKKKLKFPDLFDKFHETDERLTEKFRVYEDIRERGLLVRTGFKFGCDFRVYERGVKLKKGPKAKNEHTKWIVFAVPEDYTCSFQELSRAVRLAHNIRAKMLWAIVDNEGDCTYYQVLRMKP